MKVSPTATSVTVAVLRTVTFGKVTGIVSVFDAAEPVMVLPSGELNEYEAVA
ncbi:hypothetical protein D3C71_2151070 [compost metagenome]